MTEHARAPSQSCVDVDECAASPCKNGGTCVDSIDNNAIALGAYECACTTNVWKGKNCTLDARDLGYSSKAAGGGARL